MEQKRVFGKVYWKSAIACFFGGVSVVIGYGVVGWWGALSPVEAFTAWLVFVLSPGIVAIALVLSLGIAYISAFGPQRLRERLVEISTVRLTVWASILGFVAGLVSIRIIGPPGPLNF